MKLTAGIAEKRIHTIAQRSEMVITGMHARDRMAEREIDDVDVLRALRRGHVNDPPERTELDEWQCKVVMPMKSGRSIGVVVILLNNGRLFVKTVEWED